MHFQNVNIIELHYYYLELQFKMRSNKYTNMASICLVIRETAFEMSNLRIVKNKIVICIVKPMAA